MKVRCLQIIHPAADIPVAEYDGIRVGGVYPVVEVVANDTDVQIRVLGPGTTDPGLLWDPADFETVDTRIPPGWTLVIADGHTRLADPRWQRPGFWTDYHHSDPQALADYKHVRHELLADERAREFTEEAMPPAPAGDVCIRDGRMPVGEGVEIAEPVTGDYPAAPRLPLLTAAEARDTIGHLRLLESLDLTHQGEAAGQFAADLARRLSSE